MSKAGEESGFSIASMASDGFIHVFPVKKDKTPRTGKVAGIHNDNICLKLFGMQVYVADTGLNLI